MAYCPRCGREQRCGCDKCHICGVEVVERRIEDAEPWMRAEARAAGRATRRSTSRLRVGEPATDSPDGGRRDALTHAAAQLPTVLLLFGCGILLVTLIEAISAATNFPAAGGSASLADALRRLGYYLGNLLYAASVRTIIGFALVSLGLLLEPGRPFADRELARKATRTVGLAQFVVALLCLLAALLVVLPVGSTSLLTRNLLPTKWAAVSTLVAMGAALLSGGYLLMARPVEPRNTSRSASDDDGIIHRGLEGPELANAGGDADESNRYARRQELEGGLEGRPGSERGGPVTPAEQGEKAD
jgi:hypothetical protein